MEIEDKHVSWLLFITVVLILIIGGAFVVKSFFWRPQPIVIEFKYAEVDTCFNEVASFYSKAEVDSVVSLLKHHEDSLISADQSIKEKEWEKDYKNILVYGVSIIVALAGFFGYKSIHDVKNDSKEIAKNVSEKETRLYLENKLGELVNREMQNVYNEQTYQTIITRIKADLITVHEFTTNSTIKKCVIDILEDWTLDIRPNPNTTTASQSEDQGNPHTETDNQEPQDFND